MPNRVATGRVELGAYVRVLTVAALCLASGCGGSGGGSGAGGSSGTSGSSGSSGSGGVAGTDIFDPQSPVKVTWREPLPEGGRTEQLVCPSASVCYSTSGHFIRKSGDGGGSWTTAGPFVGTFVAFECPLENVCYGVVHESVADHDYFVKTADGGASWQLLEDFTASSSQAVLSCPDELSCLINRNGISTTTVGFRTFDGGQTVDTFRPPAGSNLNWHCFDTRECVGFGNGLLRTTDGGDSFEADSTLGLFFCDREFCWEQDLAEFRVSTDRVRTRIPHPTPPIRTDDYYGAVCSSEGSCLAADSTGVALWFSDNASRTWQVATPPPPTLDAPEFASYANIREVVACADAGRCFAGDPSRRFYTSGDAGRTWSERYTPSTGPEAAHAIDCPAPDACYVVGQAGKIIKSTDRGVSWTRLATNQTEDLHDISCPDAATCFASGSNGQLLKTSDGGAVWNVMAQPAVATLGRLSCPTVDVCYLDAESGQLMKTVDGGASWSLVHDFSAVETADYRFNAVECFDPLICVVLVRGQRGNLTPSYSPLRTLDGGATWESASDAQFYVRFDSLQNDDDKMACSGPAACVGGPLAVSCPSSASCVHYGRDAGSVKYMVSDSAPADGALPTRDVRSVRTTISHAEDLHCFDEKHCIAVGDQAVVTIDVE